MLTQLVRPMVRTQLRLLASCQATHPTLVSTICQWLGFLGVQAQVNQLQAQSENIQVSLTVAKPDACDPQDWEKILNNLGQTTAAQQTQTGVTHLNTAQQRTFVRLMAYLLQVGHPQQHVDWSQVAPKLQSMDLAPATLTALQSALRIPQSLELLVEELDPDLAAIALPQAVSIALMDRQVNPCEAQVLSALFQLIKPEPSVPS
ncbi:hypothetical protein GS597_11705 [Synechococcales cyanobacterium C]|uniref:Uncharacterized protein n=1 Tax=Petrachloros mirabilis ULC683 TaxID=2781853 RepID=A0A8K2A0F8_9CYAN|nr:hypothetical protein [Petrachloros mirabilis]NCJ07157.1 hypothetical protein [Petrachloros mirabilis ULC683]